MKWAMVTLMVSATVLSDVLQSFEMKRAGEQTVGARGLVRILKLIASRRYLILGVVCMAGTFFAFLEVVQKAPLRFVVRA